MIVVRISLEAGSAAVARALTQQVTHELAQWGRTEIINLGPDRRHPGDYSLDLRLDAVPGRGGAQLIRNIAERLVIGPWEFHDDDPDEPWAVWDARRGGDPVLRATRWICLEVAP